MLFQRREIELACELKRAGLPWTPSVGHYVYDSEGVVRPPSPFQDHVYFILNYEHFMNLIGGVERFRERMTWLPLWHDARAVLRSLEVTDAEVQSVLMGRGAIEAGSELIVLYELIASRLGTVACARSDP